MEVFIRSYLYKNLDFINKKLDFESNIKFALNEWQLKDNIYADVAEVEIAPFESNLCIAKVINKINKISFERFNKISFDAYPFPRFDDYNHFFAYSIYREKECPKYKFNKIWKDL